MREQTTRKVGKVKKASFPLPCFLSLSHTLFLSKLCIYILYFAWHSGLVPVVACGGVCQSMQTNYYIWKIAVCWSRCVLVRFYVCWYMIEVCEAGARPWEWCGKVLGMEKIYTREKLNTNLLGWQLCVVRLCICVPLFHCYSIKGSIVWMEQQVFRCEAATAAVVVIGCRCDHIVRSPSKIIVVSLTNSVMTKVYVCIRAWRCGLARYQ